MAISRMAPARPCPALGSDWLVSLTLGGFAIRDCAVLPPMCDRVVRSLLARGAGDRFPGYRPKDRQMEAGHRGPHPVSARWPSAYQGRHRLE